MLRSILGRGASGVVWLATHETLTRDYAIKFLDPQHMGSSSEGLADRFHFEAQISCRLGADMENIVAVHDAGVFRGQPYMVMDLVRGDSVLSVIRRGPMHLSDIARMISDIAAALTACHREGLAHRDTKPANILHVESTKRYRLTDFGLAKFFGEAPSELFVPKATTGSMLIGTPAYMSPEAISADRTRCGRGDVWSLAVTLYECLTGALPFQGEGWPSVAVAIMKRKYKYPSEVHPRLQRFDALFIKAFAADVDDRFQTPAELVEALDAVIKRASNRPPIAAAVPISLTPMTVRAVRPELPSEPLVLQSFTVDSVAPPAPTRSTRTRWPYYAAGAAGLLMGGLVAVQSSIEVKPARNERAIAAEPALSPPATPRVEASSAPSAAPSASVSASGHPHAKATPPGAKAAPSASVSASSYPRKPFDASEVW